MEGAEEPDFYTGCAQITLESDCNSFPSEVASIPGYVDGSEPGLTFNAYDGSNRSGYEYSGPSITGDYTASNASDSSGQGQEISNGSYNSTNGVTRTTIIIRLKQTVLQMTKAQEIACLLTPRLADPLTSTIRLGMVIQAAVTHPTALTAPVKGRTHITQVRW